MSTGSPAIYSHKGYCPICEKEAEFTSCYDWYRDHLFCSGCRSIPRERALALVLSRCFPTWRDLAIHESSPVLRGISAKMKRECSQYVASQHYAGDKLGKSIRGFRNEDLEAQTFADRTFDLVVTQDVMEHVNRPDEAMREIARTLKPGGGYLFTVPTYKDHLISERRAMFKPDGTIECEGVPEYHGNPVDDQGSLVTFRYGYDLPELIYRWSGMNVEVTRFHDHYHGLIGEFTEVYLARVTG